MAASPEFRAADNFVKAVDGIGFRLEAFATRILGKPIDIQERVLALFTAIVIAGANRYDNDLYAPEEMALYIRYKRMAEIILIYDID